MNKTPTQHPSEQQLSDFSLGRLSADESEFVSQHIMICEQCCTALDVLAEQPDDFLRKLKQVSDQRDRSGKPVIESDSHRSAVQPTTVTSTTPQIDGYEVLDELGRGGMGVVYRVRQVGLDRLVALKIILAGAQATPEEQIRFRKEAHAVAQLVHPNIVQVYETGATDGIPYFTMEYVEGSTLKDAIAGKPWNPMLSAKLTKSLAEAMQSAHDRGIIHRDLKPANVMLPKSVSNESDESDSWLKQATPKITDFGLAKRLGDHELTQPGTVAGTPGFMAPEQALPTKGGVGIAADVYSIGAILYNLITGRPPFEADTAIQILNQLIEQDPLSPRALNPSVDRDLETICLKCLEKEPIRRYGSAIDLAEDLGRYLNGRPIRARKVSAAGKLLRWSRRNRWLAAVSAALMVLLVSAAIAGPLVAFSYSRLAKAERVAASEARKSRSRADTQARLAQRQRAMAEREAATSNEVSSFLLGLFDDADPLAWSGRAFGILTEVNPSAIEIVDRGAKSLGDKTILQDQPLVRATILDKIGTVYLSLGRIDKARPLLFESLELRSEHLPPDHPDLAASLHSSGYLHFASGNMDRAEEFLKKSLAMRERILGEDHPYTLESTVQLGILYLVPPKREAEGKALLTRALEVYRSQQRDSTHATSLAGRDIQWMFMTLAALTYNDLQSANAVDLDTLSLVDELQQIARAVPNRELGGIIVHFIDAEKQRYAGNTVAKVSSMLARTHFQHAEAEYRDALDLGEKTGTRNHYMLAWIRREFGYFLVEQRRYQEAESEFVEALRVYRMQFRESNAAHLTQMLYQTAQCILHGRYAKADRREDRQRIRDEIEKYLSQAVEIGDTAPEMATRQRAIHLFVYSEFLQQSLPPRYEESIAHLNEALEIRQRVFGRQSPQSLQCVALIINGLARQEKIDVAARLVDSWIAGGSDLPWPQRSLPLLVGVAEIFAGQDRVDMAMALLRQAHAAGFRDVRRLNRSAAFAALNQNADFQQLREQIQNELKGND
ncbi:serine/threonine-protein kinase [Stieleria sp. JC731]|uniref:serine/threonine-protein kinase n=1 Tax=Pirellulaceae TaxID=2691357 RepID=UPI001E5A4A73|nr:serine/threonine-protein kinase [Stieleria sp. JC731]MCC9600303.1 serine/threonine-protein kinase [Stieleria sp. JC731]